jgi:hypothetical protein
MPIMAIGSNEESSREPLSCTLSWSGTVDMLLVIVCCKASSFAEAMQMMNNSKAMNKMLWMLVSGRFRMPRQDLVGYTNTRNISSTIGNGYQVK